MARRLRAALFELDPRTGAPTVLGYTADAAVIESVRASVEHDEKAGRELLRRLHDHPGFKAALTEVVGGREFQKGRATTREPRP